MTHVIAFIGLGVMAGILSGLIGIGGGIIIVPFLVLFFGFSQKLAQGTTLALMLPPLGVFAAWAYYRHGFIDVRAAMFICLGFLAGSIMGADLALHLPTVVLTRVFGVVLIAIGIRMLFLG